MNTCIHKISSARRFLPLFVLLTMVSVIGVCIVKIQAAQSSSKAEDEISDLRRARLVNAVVPIGAVIPYYGDPSDLRDTGWQLCNGDPVDGAAPDWLKSMGNVPDLRGRFLRGSTETSAEGETQDDGYGLLVQKLGGQDVVTLPAQDTVSNGAHEHRVADHRHGLPARTGLVSTNIGFTMAQVNAHGDGQWKNENDEWVDYVQAHGRGGNAEGQHVHDLGGSTGRSDPLTDRHTGHAHSVPAVDIQVLPRYAEVHYIMRIR